MSSIAFNSPTYWQWPRRNNLKPFGFICRGLARQTDGLIGSGVIYQKDLYLPYIILFQLGEECLSNHSIVDMRVYEGISSLLDLREVVPPYALAARTCHAEVHAWDRYFAVQEPVECIFDKGDLEQAKFSDLVVDEGGDPPIYKDKKDFAGL